LSYHSFKVSQIIVELAKLRSQSNAHNHHEQVHVVPYEGRKHILEFAPQGQSCGVAGHEEDLIVGAQKVVLDGIGGAVAE